MAIQFRTLHRNPILEKGYELQKICLGGKITTPQDIEKRMDSADLNMRNTCEYCKGGIKCLQSQCPVKYAHIKVISILLDMDEVLQKFEAQFFEEEENYKKILDDTMTDDELRKELSSWWYRQYKALDIFPYVDAREENLQDLLALHKEAIEKANNPTTGLDKIKKLLGGN